MTVANLHINKNTVERLVHQIHALNSDACIWTTGCHKTTTQVIQRSQTRCGGQYRDFRLSGGQQFPSSKEVIPEYF